MFTRLAISIFSGAAVTFGLLYLMQLMIADSGSALTGAHAYRLQDFVRVERAQTVETRRRRPKRPQEPESPPERPSTESQTSYDGALAVSIDAPVVKADPQVGHFGFGVTDGEYLPIVKVAPVYPTRALARRLEGSVLVEFTVTRNGTVKDVIVVESTAELFEKPAIEAALKFRYKPRIVNGAPIEVRGVRNRLIFTLDV